MLNYVEQLLIASKFRAIDLMNSTRVYVKIGEAGLVNSAFLLVDISGRETQEVLVDLQPLLLNALESIVSTESFEKNTTVILLLQHSENDDEIYKRVSEIEEDQYFFKKQVLFYTEKEKSALSGLPPNDSPVNALEEVLYDQKRFMTYSEGSNDILYQIVARIFTKLPFLTVQRAAQSRPNLSETITRQLESQDLMTFRDKLLSLSANEDDLIAWINSVEED